MTLSPPQVNGHERPAMPLSGDWLPVTPDPVELAPVAAPAPNPVAEAEAEAIRARAYAESEARRIKAEAEAEAIRIKAAADAEKQRLTNERQAMAMEEKQAAHAARLAKIEAERAETERQAAEAEAKAEEKRHTEVVAAEATAAAAKTWRRYAIQFYIVCAVVALPVQIAAFWDPKAWWLVIAPLMLEGAALVVTKGAAAAVAARRPHWHYRTVAWMFAFIAAGINLWHGLNAFDPATALGTAFASIAGPGVWDLHEHGRIRRRDGVLTRRERRAQRKAEKKAAGERAAEQARLDAEKKAADKAEAERLKELAAGRAARFQKVWEHAEGLACAMGETTVTESIWIRAHRDIEGTDPGETADIIHGRNNAKRRLASAVEGTRVNASSKGKDAQRAAHLPPTANKPRVKPVPPRRKRGDSEPFHPAAKRLAADTARQFVTARVDEN
ncbi:hypothetical protein [Streptomyces sp. NPDC087525]|uniref:hypothetical protein n=1 Tax=Streptomyces sp. NPDC087525 TaxID=3365793 RepID=UPI0037FE372B